VPGDGAPAPADAVAQPGRRYNPGVEARLVEFAALLRHNGLRVSSAEIVDATRAAALTGIDDRPALRAVLRCTLVKRSPDVATFDRLFDLYFSSLSTVLDGIERGILADLEASGLLAGPDLEMLALTLAQLPGNMSPLTRAALTGDQATLMRLLRGAAVQVDFSGLGTAIQVGFYGRRVLGAAGGSGMSKDFAELEAELKRRGLDPAAMELVADRLSRALRGVEEAARRYAELEQRARAEQKRQDAFGARAFTALSREDIQKAEAAVRRLADRLKSRLARRERSRRRGALNVRRTLRRNLGLGGVPAKLTFRQRRPERPDVVVLCDVSDSVRHVSRLMLLFLYTLQSLWSRVRTFVFVSDLGEVTQAFKDERDVSRAIDLATAGKTVSLYANSNYGRALELFHRDHLGAVSRRTTVIVIGDGRNNYNPPNAWVLKELKRKARRLVWICPEERRGWGFGDSEMPLYAAQVDRVATVTSLEDLERIAEELVPKGPRGGDR
jgi:uncharacterized protein with von Willebrand factor type A (vWA) domain